MQYVIIKPLENNLVAFIVENKERRKLYGKEYIYTCKGI